MYWCLLPEELCRQNLCGSNTMEWPTICIVRIRELTVAIIVKQRELSSYNVQKYGG